MGASADVVRKKVAAFNTHDPEQLRPLFSPEVEQHLSGNPVSKGFDEAVALYKTYWDAFPDFTISLQHVVEDGPTVCVEGRAVGTHTDALRTPSGDIPATGQHVDFGWMDRYEVENGRIVSSNLYFDTLVVLEQLGLAPASAQV
jgi:predicted ester cyclase